MLIRECAGRNPVPIACLIALALLAAPLCAAHAQNVLPGFDLYITSASDTEFDFSTQPLPADFFGPGSDPFDGGVPASTFPLPDNPYWPLPPTLCPSDDLSNIDTIVERIDPASLPGVGSSDVIDIEIVALSLRSTDPITVTYNGGLNPELWDMYVCLSTSQPQITGNMLVRKTHSNGGTFDSDLPVIPKFVFVRQSDAQERTLDGGDSPFWTDTIEALDVPWEYVAPDPVSCRSNFCAPDPFLQIGPKFVQGVLPTCAVAVPATRGAAMLVLAVALAGFGVLVIRRFAGTTT
jgi:hypothetical protein